MQHCKTLKTLKYTIQSIKYKSNDRRSPENKAKPVYVIIRKAMCLIVIPAAEH